MKLWHQHSFEEITRIVYPTTNYNPILYKCKCGAIGELGTTWWGLGEDKIKPLKKKDFLYLEKRYGKIFIVMLAIISKIEITNDH